MSEDTKKEEDWFIYKNNPVMEISKVSKQFRCKEHSNLGETNQGGAGRHSVQIHGMRLDGTKVEKKKPKETVEPAKTEETESEEEKALGERIAEIESQLSQSEGKKEEDTIDIMQLPAVRMDQDIAETATKVVTNLRLQFMYYITKKCHIFPIDMTFPEWIDANVTDSLKNIWHVHIDFSTDLKKLEPMQLKVIKENIKNYKETGSLNDIFDESDEWDQKISYNLH